jgi:Arc/MetJ family transcription regulator
MVNLELDDDLIEAVTKLSGLKTKQEAVTQALQEYIQRHKRASILQLFGTIDYDAGDDHRPERAPHSLTPAERQAWHDDQKIIAEAAVLPESPWEKQA